MAAKKRARNAPTRAVPADKRVYFSQTDFPQTTLQQAQKVASALVDNFAGKDGSPPDVALAIGISPTSSGWRTLTGSSIAYGLTDGGFNANTIKLTSLGRRLVAPEEKGADLVARREAITKPRISKQFFERYRRAKFPADTSASSVVRSLGAPPDRVQAALDIIKANGRYAGIIRETPTGPRRGAPVRPRADVDPLPPHPRRAGGAGGGGGGRGRGRVHALAQVALPLAGLGGAGRSQAGGAARRGPSAGSSAS